MAAAQSNSLSSSTNLKSTDQTSNQELLARAAAQRMSSKHHQRQCSCIMPHIVKHFVTSVGTGACNLKSQEAGMGHGQDSCCDDRLKPRLRRFMAARPPAMPSFTRSLAVAVAAVARAAASLAPNLHRHKELWSVKHILITTSHLKYCFIVKFQHRQYIFHHLML